MKFGPSPVAEAEGAIAAHSIRLPSRKLQKGKELTASDIADLQAAGFTEVIVARLGPEDLDENTAAERITAALVTDPDKQNIRVTKAATGRVNLHAKRAGVVGFDPARIHAANAIDPMITIATLPHYKRVEAGAMIATVKIIAYGVAATNVTKAAEALSTAMMVHAPRYQSATLIETVIDGTTHSDKGRRATNTRLSRLDVALTPRIKVPHKSEAIAEAIKQAEGEVILILTASATSDIADVAPSAVRMAGGAVERFGMPVDPGNLLFIGSYNGRPVIGLPGCARSPALNGADWVLERTLCGIDVTDSDIATMGVGGLLKEMPTRPKPRST